MKNWSSLTSTMVLLKRAPWQRPSHLSNRERDIMDTPIIPQELSSASGAIGKLCEYSFSGPAAHAARRKARLPLSLYRSRSNVFPVFRHHQFDSGSAARMAVHSTLGMGASYLKQTDMFYQHMQCHCSIANIDTIYNKVWYRVSLCLKDTSCDKNPIVHY